MEILEKVIFFVAEKGKLTGKIRLKIKSLFYPMFLLYCRIRWKIKKELYLYHVELPITLKCSLKCKHCVFMMTKFDNPYDFELENLLNSMEKFFSCIDSVQIFRILGGEPFLYKDLSKIIERCLQCDKLKTIEIVTNGTIIPSEAIFNMMKNDRITVQISDYGSYSRCKDNLKTECDKRNIKCVIRSSDKKTWNDAGDLHYRNRNSKQLMHQMKKCANICRNLMNGKLYYCARSAFGTQLEIPDNTSDYIDLTEKISINELKEKIYNLNQKKYLSACNYCDAGTEYYVEVPVAEQI